MNRRFLGIIIVQHQPSIISIAMWNFITNSTVLQYGISSAILLMSFWALRTVLVQAVLKAQNLSGETRRRWIVTIRNILVGTFIVGMIFIWESQLSTFAVSLVAVGVALVLATKELIACLSGGLLRVVTNAYGLGDRIEISGLRGIIVDYNWLTTTLLEIGPGQTSHQYTGRAMIIPNSLLFTQPITNETYSKKFVVHVLTVRLTTEDDWQRAEHLLLGIAQEECAPYITEADAYLKKLEGKNWLDAPSAEPRVTIQLPESGKITLLLRVPSPAHRTARIEQAILRRFLLAQPFSKLPHSVQSLPASPVLSSIS